MLLFFVYCYRLFGWGAWIRTMSNLLQRQVCYHYTTPHSLSYFTKKIPLSELYNVAMKIISEKLKLSELNEMAKNMFGNLVKAVVDVEKKIMAIDGELHSDEETLLIQGGSIQKNLWGINIYPEAHKENFIEFDSMINIRPSIGNKTRGVDNEVIRKLIITIVDDLIIK